MAEKLPGTKDVSGVSLNTVIWKCPVCRLIPTGQIYQCPDGHSFCLACTADGKSCPICNVKISGYKLGVYGVRNHLAESLLDQMKFECRWKDHGCKTLVARNEIFAHENVCTYGPIYLCRGFPSTCLLGCKFQVYLHKSLNIDRILSHIRTAHDTFLVKTGMEFGEVCNINMDKQLQNNISCQTQNYTIPTFVEIVHFKNGSEGEPTREIFIFLRKVVFDAHKNTSISWAFVWLTSEVKENDFSVKMKLTIRGKPNPELSAKLGNDFVPDLNWTLEPISAREFAEWVSSKNQKLKFPFFLPLSHINKYYVDTTGVFTISFTILNE